MNKILLTCFEAFNNKSTNTTTLVVEKINHNNIYKLTLPVSYSRSVEVLKQVVRDYKPDLIISLGGITGMTITVIKCVGNYRYNMMIEYEELGYKYFNGKGVEKNYKLAMEYYLKAAKYNSHFAMHKIGYMYDNGLGVKQSYIDAFNWYLKAAKLGNGRSQNSVGSMYENGDGVTQDLLKALDWYILASEKGVKLADENIENLKLKKAASVTNHEKLHYIKEYREKRKNGELTDPELNDLYKTIIENIRTHIAPANA